MNFKKINKKFSFYFADFRTIIVNNKHYVTCYSLHNNNSNKLYGNFISFLTEENLEQKSSLLLKQFVDECFANTVNENIIYFHNLSRFNGFFILNSCFNKTEYSISLITRDNIIYEIKIFHNITKRCILFRDLFLLLPISFESFLTLYHYNTVKLKINSNCLADYSDLMFLSFLVSNCKLNTFILNKLFILFCKDIYSFFNIFPYSCLTLSALSFKIFRSQFYFFKNVYIYKSIGPLFTFIEKSYKGGIVDVYKPYLEKGYQYDVNSLYPYVMSTFEMPVNRWIYGNAEFELNFNIQTFFGFIEVDVISPDSYMPFLPFSHDKLGLITPTGSWSGIYFSEEIKYALTLGYSFKYKSYYKFDKAIIFKDYVNCLYTKRLENKNNALNSILKLLLNSLYGRFGMSLNFNKTLIIDLVKDYKLYQILNLFYQTTFSSINNNIGLLKYNNQIDLNSLEELNKFYNFSFSNNINHNFSTNTAIHIASAITAYGRIYMHKLKNHYKNNLYYSDTDSIILDCPLDSTLVSSTKLGYLKLERKIDFALFIAPKIYYIKSGVFEIKKFKGLNNMQLSFNDYIKLYNKEILKITSLKKFIINLTGYHILQKETKLKIQGVFLKRIKVYKNNIWVNTSPLKLYLKNKKNSKE